MIVGLASAPISWKKSSEKADLPENMEPMITAIQAQDSNFALLRLHRQDPQLLHQSQQVCLPP